MDSFGGVRKITLCDLDRIVEIENKCFNEKLAYTTEEYRYLITMANSSCLAEIMEDKIRGFIIILYNDRSEVAGIETINVDPVYRGNGIGRRLLSEAENDMFYRGIRKIRLEVSTQNIPAINLYEKSGFRKISIIKNYYYYEHNGTRDAFRMIKELTT